MLLFVLSMKTAKERFLLKLLPPTRSASSSLNLLVVSFYVVSELELKASNTLPGLATFACLSCCQIREVKHLVYGKRQSGNSKQIEILKRFLMYSRTIEVLSRYVFHNLNEKVLILTDVVKGQRQKTSVEETEEEIVTLQVMLMQSLKLYSRPPTWNNGCPMQKSVL